MTNHEPLLQKVVGISISGSQDMASLGLAEEHLHDAMTELARHLLAMGTRLVYGGDLREGGFTELLFELVARYHRDAGIGDSRPVVANYLAWPVHRTMQPEAIQRVAQSLQGLSELHFLNPKGQEISIDALNFKIPFIADEDWSSGLTAMRHVVTGVCDARIVLGGKVTGFKGRMPGIAEEALCAITTKQPLYVLGGFGGCARDIAEELGLLPVFKDKSVAWVDRAKFSGFTTDDLNNGLNYCENSTLARTTHIDEAVILIIRGLFRFFGQPAENCEL